MNFKPIVVLGVIGLTVSSCGGKEDAEVDLVSATITDFVTEECYCCPGVTLDIEGQQFLVEEFPDSQLTESDLPRTVVVELMEYSGTCPNKDKSVLYHH